MAAWERLYWLLIFVYVFTQLANADDGGGKHFVLIHGLGHGAWCWYKVTSALQAAGHVVTTLDLTSNGNNKAVADDVADVAHFVQPLTDFLASYGDGKVTLVGHSLGGSAISYAMEMHPDKIEKAVFIAALMPRDGQLFIPITTIVAVPNLILNKVITLNFRNGISLPTSGSVNLKTAQANFYNRSPPEDVALALACLNDAPLSPSLNKLTLTETRYGSIPRIYIKTTDDNIFPAQVQTSIINRNPPSQVLTVPESDHSVFFSQPAALVNLLISRATN